VIDFLASSAASFVNGQTIAVDGGFSAGRKFAAHPK
jgi:NAD(P)-dependent dehydrogenase (short-subunit alcohol dehydrogenase family)